jgi:hypothetical protein
VDFIGAGGALDVGITLGVSDSNQSRNTTQSSFMSFVRNLTLSDVHTVLEVAGLVPGLGALPDLADAALHVYEGNYGEAALSAVGVLPSAPVMRLVRRPQHTNRCGKRPR